MSTKHIVLQNTKTRYHLFHGILFHETLFHGTSLGGGNASEQQFIPLPDNPQLFRMTAQRLERLFKRWQARLKRYFGQTTIEAIKKASAFVKDLDRDGTQDRLVILCDFLNKNNIDRSRPKRAKVVFQQLNPGMYRRIMHERNGIGTIAKTVEWLLITYTQLNKRSWGDSAQQAFVKNAYDQLDHIWKRIDVSPVGHLFRTTNSGHIGNAVGQRFEDDIQQHESSLRRLMVKQNPENWDEQTMLYYNCYLMRRTDKGKEIVLREIDIIGIDSKQNMCLWGEIKSNPYDVAYKAKSQFYRFIRTFSHNCATCQNNNACRCKMFIRTKGGKTLYNISAPWLFDIEEIASLHGVIITTVPKHQLPIPSDIGHAVMPIFYNFLANQATAWSLQQTARTISMIMSGYETLTDYPIPAVIMVQQMK